MSEPEAITPAEQWMPATPAYRSTPGGRDRDLLLHVARQFDLEHAPRYQPGQGRTWCNIYLWDATSALGAEVPHWVDLDGNPAPPGHGAELSATATVAWLERHGPAHGWSECDEGAARAAAGGGRPAVAVWANPQPGHSGHVALVLPDEDPAGPALIAQAGAHNYFMVPLARGFGTLKPRYFQHA